jgi:SOS-response transcriptional repressor LexA
MDEVENVKERLIKFLKYKKLSQSKFEKMCGLGNGYVNNIRSAIGPNKVQNIIRQFPELNIAWLLLGEQYGGPMLKGETEKKFEKHEAPTMIEHALPLIPFEAVAGPGAPVYEDERVENYYTVSEFKESDFLIRVKGDSMAPHFTGGDLLACKKVSETYFLQWGRCYVVYTRSQGCMVKRVQPSEKEGYIKCVSDNAKYAPFDVPMNDIVSVALVNGSISLE